MSLKSVALTIVALVLVAAAAMGVMARTLRQDASGPVLFDIVLANGRVIDPETRLDAVRNVVIIGGRIGAVSEARLRGRQEVDASGLVVAPGFIDWHAHGQNTLADRVQAFDGVTTALELEAGMLPIGRWYDRQARSHRVVNSGAAASWGIARMVTMDGIPLPAEPSAVLAGRIARAQRSPVEKEGTPPGVQDRATYTRPNQLSVGVRHVLVNGTFVIRDGVLDTTVFPGLPVRRSPTVPSARGLTGAAER